MDLRNISAFFSRVLIAVLLPLPLLAAEAEKEGLPQFDAEMFPGQLFWLAVSFALLYILMSQLALPGIAKVQNRRRSVIDAELAAATAASEAAKVTMAKYEQALKDARAQAQASVSAILAGAARESIDRQSVQQKELNKRLLEAEARIERAKNAALREAQGMAPELAAVMVEKIAGTKLRVS